jgi:hypothetical protein
VPAGLGNSNIWALKATHNLRLFDRALRQTRASHAGAVLCGAGLTQRTCNLPKSRSTRGLDPCLQFGLLPVCPELPKRVRASVCKLRFLAFRSIRRHLHAVMDMWNFLSWWLGTLHFCSSKAVLDLATMEARMADAREKEPASASRMIFPVRNPTDERKFTVGAPTFVEMTDAMRESSSAQLRDEK